MAAKVTTRSGIDLIGWDLDDRGDLAVRVQKMSFLDGVLVFKEPHRFGLRPGDDIDAMVTRVNAALAADGSGSFPPLPDEDVAELKAQAERKWTPARIEARKERDRIAEEETRARTEEAAAAKAEQDRAEGARIQALVDDAIKRREAPANGGKK